eukprot:Nitzschia sp. Nitz4//scaffold60_size111251//8023//9384//NITZ4_004135-RA/size111251-processed-gene-0.23-mRNA-1//-1//CDS//3329555528//3076//frame0
MPVYDGKESRPNNKSQSIAWASRSSSEAFSIRAKCPATERILFAGTQGDLNELREAPRETLRQAYCTSGCSLLHWAAGSNQIEVLDYLVSQLGLDVDTVATKKSKGRTPLHYACRNGCFEATRWLLEVGRANPDAKAKHGVTPFQLAVWQNQLAVCKYLVEEHNVDPAQQNDFCCAGVHWIGLCPHEDADLLPLAKWLAQQPGVSFHVKQKTGHSPMHKAAWGGHLELIRYFHEEHGLWDDSPDEAGNYAADMADMARSSRHAKVAAFLREHCSVARAESCRILGISTMATVSEIRKAYLERAKAVHPDSQGENGSKGVEFCALHDAYRHLIDEGGRGNQSNPAHSLKLMLELNGAPEDGQIKADDYFKARLVAVLLEYGHKGLDLSNIKRKWEQVWPDAPFPTYEGSLSDFISSEASDVVDFVNGEKVGSMRVVPKLKQQQQLSQLFGQRAS